MFNTIHAEGLNLREACELKYVPKSGKSPKGGRGQHQKSKSPQFKIWTI